MPNKTKHQNGGVNVSGVSGDLSVGGDVVGRDKTVIDNRKIYQVISGTVPFEDQLEFFGRQIGLENFQAIRYTNSQFEVLYTVISLKKSVKSGIPDRVQKYSKMGTF